MNELLLSGKFNRETIEGQIKLEVDNGVDAQRAAENIVAACRAYEKQPGEFKKSTLTLISSGEWRKCTPSTKKQKPDLLTLVRQDLGKKGA